MKRLIYFVILLILPTVAQAQTKTPAEAFTEAFRQARAERTALEIERMRTLGPQIWEDNIVAARSHAEYAILQIDSVEEIIKNLIRNTNMVIQGREIDDEGTRKWIDDLKLFKKEVQESRYETRKFRRSTKRASRGIYAPMHWGIASNLYSELEIDLKNLEKFIKESIRLSKITLE